MPQSIKNSQQPAAVAETGHEAAPAARPGLRFSLSQEGVVSGLAVVVFCASSILLPGFFDVKNLLSLLQDISVLGILGVAMGVVIIGRGIDLALAATMMMSVGWTFSLVNGGVSVPAALLLGLSFALAVGLFSGVVIAYVEVPALFATLAISSLVFGFARYALFDLDVIYVPENAGWIRSVGSGSLFGIPSAVIVFILVALLATAYLNLTKFGRFIRAMGDNPQAARNHGVPMRPMIVSQYVMTSIIGFVAGIVSATLVSSINTRQVGSSLLYDVILIVVLGGIGLSGGRGGIRNVVVGAILIGILFNAMTIANISYTSQNIVKGVILLLSIIVDTILNPRDEQTSQQGDI